MSMLFAAVSMLFKLDDQNPKGVINFSKMGVTIRSKNP